MAVDTEYIVQLVLDEITGIITAADDAILKELLQKEPEAYAIWEEMHQHLDTGPVKAFLNNLPEALPVENIWNLIHQKARRQKLRIMAISIAACLIMPLFLISVFKGTNQLPAALTDLPVNHVMLQLGDGVKINLDKLPHQQQRIANIELRQQQNKEMELQYADISQHPEIICNIPAGREYTLILPDGSRLHMNESSRLRIPATFDKKNRKVYIQGETYFTVKSDPQHPFAAIVQDSTIVQALGTEFNINTSGDKRVSVALVKGLVKMKTPKDSLLLRPGQAGGYEEGKELQRIKYDPATMLAWEKGIYHCNNATIEQLASYISRCYKITTIVDPPATITQTFTWYFNRQQPLKASLDRLSSTGALHYYIDKDSILHIK
jgi:transmembrane sensor